jgi:hypothetical protein
MKVWVLSFCKALAYKCECGGFIMAEIKNKLSKPGNLSDNEWKILNKMLSVDFEGKDILLNQLNCAEVISYCSCGCKTIDIQVDENMPRYEYIKRIPVEIKTITSDGIPIIASLHVVNGYISELESIV